MAEMWEVTADIVLSTRTDSPSVHASIDGPKGPSDVDWYWPSRLAVGGGRRVGTHLFAVLPLKQTLRWQRASHRYERTDQAPFIGLAPPSEIPDAMHATGQTSAFLLYDDRTATTAVALLLRTDVALNMHEPALLWLCMDAELEHRDDLAAAGPGCGLGPIVTGVQLPNIRDMRF